MLRWVDWLPGLVVCTEDLWAPEMELVRPSLLPVLVFLAEDTLPVRVADVPGLVRWFTTALLLALPETPLVRVPPEYVAVPPDLACLGST
jgi:hypothetical protein